MSPRGSPGPRPSRPSPAGLGGAAPRAPQLQVGGGGGSGPRRGAEGRGQAAAEAVHQPPQHAVPAALGRRQPHVVAQLLQRHLQVARVPEHPPDEAEEDADAARVDEQVGEEHVGEHPGQQHRQAQRVEGQRQPEGGHAAAQPAGGRHGGGAAPPGAARTWGGGGATPEGWPRLLQPHLPVRRGEGREGGGRPQALCNRLETRPCSWTSLSGVGRRRQAAASCPWRVEAAAVR